MARRCFLAYFILTSCLVGGESTKYQLQGQGVSLKSNIPGRPDGILWQHNGNKVVEFNGQEEHVYKQFENRITLDWHTAELNISNLRFEDSGEYELEVDINKKLSRYLHKLEVIDKVAKPAITCEVNDGSSSNKSATLKCSAESRRPRPLTKFEWKSKGNVLPGPKLTIPLGGKHDDEVHNCNVSNPLGHESAAFTAKDCYTETSSVGLIAGLVCAFVLLPVIIGLILYLKLCKKACFAEGDSEKQPQHGQTEAPEAARLLHGVHRESTLASKQPLRHLNNNGVGNDTDEHMEAAPPSPPRSPLDMNNQSHNQSDEDEEEPRGPAEEVPEHAPPDSEEPNEADPPAGVSPQKPGSVRKARDFFESNCGGLTSPKKMLTDERTKAAPPSPPRSESPSQLDVNNLSHNDKSDVVEEEPRESAEEKLPQCDPSDSEKPNEADPPAGVSDDKREDTQADLEVPTSPQKPGLGNDTDEHTKAAPPSPPCSELREPAQEKIPQCDPPDSEEPNEADPPAGVSPQKPGYVKRTMSFYEEKRGGQTASQKVVTGPENVAERNAEDKEADEEERDEGDEKKKAHEDEKSAPHNAETSPAAFTAGENKEDANSDQVTEETAAKTVRESDSSGKEERKDSDEFPADKQPSTAPEEKSSETTRHEQDSNLSREATEKREDKQPETVEPVSENENETDTVKDLAEPDLYSDNSQEPPIPAPRKRNTETFAASQDPAHADQEEESHNGEGKEDKNENQCGPKEEEPANESLSEDKGAKER